MREILRGRILQKNENIDDIENIENIELEARPTRKGKRDPEEKNIDHT